MARTDSLWEVLEGGTGIKPIAPNGYNILVFGSNRYINFGTVEGALGYGFRDNAGVIEFKNLGGSWAPIGSGTGSGVNFETPSGTIDGVNAVFTVLNIPKAIILNGLTYFQNDGYTLAGLTVTMLIVPVPGSTLRSMY